MVLRRWLSLQLLAVALFAAHYSSAAWGQVVTDPTHTGISGGTVSTVACTPSQGLTCTVTNPTSAPSLAIGIGSTPTLGTPASLTLTNATGLPVSTGITGFGTGVGTFLATPTSANLAAALTDETGSGAAVFATSPTLVTPTLGAATATSVNKVAITAPASGSTLTIADGKTLTVSNSVTLAGTDGRTFTLPTQNATARPYLGSMAYSTLVGTYACGATYAGYTAYVSDWGAVGTEARCNSATSRWTPTGGQVLLKDKGAATSGITSTPTIVLQTQLPAGAWQANDTIRIWLTLGKTGTTDALIGNVYIGTAGTTGDAAVIATGTWITAAAVGTGLIFDIKLISNTSAQRVGTGPAAGLGSYSGSNSTAQSTAVTVADASANALYVSVEIHSAGSTNTVSIQGGQIYHVAQ